MRSRELRTFLKSHDTFILGGWIFLAYVFAHFKTYQASENLLNSALESLGVAHSLAITGRFADPFYVMPTGPTAHLAPIYPFLLSLILRTWGEGPAAVLAVKWFTILLVAMQAALMPLLSTKLRLGYFPGVIAGIAVVVGGFLVFLWEANLTALLILLLMFPMLGVFEKRISAKSLVGIGALWGMLFLVSPVPVLIFAAWLTWAWFKGRLNLVQLAALVLTAMVVVLPWIVRNRIVLGHAVFIRDNLGLELAQMYCDCTKISVKLNDLSDCYVTPNGSKDEAQLVIAMGEVEYNRTKLHQAIDWIHQNPRRSLELILERFAMFWFPNDSWRLSDANVGDVVLWIATPLSLPGLWLLYRMHRVAFWSFVLWIALYPTPYYLIGQGERARVPILFVTLIPAALFLCTVLENGNPFKSLNANSSNTVAMHDPN